MAGLLFFGLIEAQGVLEGHTLLEAGAGLLASLLVPGQVLQVGAFLGELLHQVVVDLAGRAEPELGYVKELADAGLASTALLDLKDADAGEAEAAFLDDIAHDKGNETLEDFPCLLLGDLRLELVVEIGLKSFLEAFGTLNSLGLLAGGLLGGSLGHFLGLDFLFLVLGHDLLLHEIKCVVRKPI